MHFTNDEIEEFKQIYKKEFGIDLADAEAFVQATNIVNFIRVICKTKENSKNHL